jgi:hypothetical protein
MTADVYINDAGTARRIRQIYVNDAGTARRIKEIYVNDAGTARQIYANGDVAIVTGAKTATGYGLGLFELNSDGTRTTLNSESGTQTWINPRGGMWQYEVFATQSSFSGAGSVGGIFGSWLPLTATRSWTTNRPSSAGAGTDQLVVALQIRRAIDSVVVATATITVNSTGP